jgi:hypothetical protein
LHMYDPNMDSELPQTLMAIDRAACGLMRSNVHLCSRRLFPIRHFGDGIGISALHNERYQTCSYDREPAELLYRRWKELVFDSVDGPVSVLREGSQWW